MDFGMSKRNVFMNLLLLCWKLKCDIGNSYEKWDRVKNKL